MSEFCDNCPLKDLNLSEQEISEAGRFAAFELGEQTHMANGTYNRFVDGFFVEPADESLQLKGESRSKAFQCGEYKFLGRCLLKKPEGTSSEGTSHSDYLQRSARPFGMSGHVKFVPDEDQ